MRSFVNRLLIFLVMGLSLHADEAESSLGKSRILEVEGTVHYAATGSGEWQPARPDQTLNFGDRVRTGKKSRAAIQLSDKSVIRLNQLTTLQIQRSATEGTRRLFLLDQGSIYFLNREKPADIEFRTPLSSGSIRGTEFCLQMSAADNSMRLTMFEGEVALRNSQGTLTFRSGDEAEVVAGEPPVKVPAIDARNVIQWVLYYPGVLDPSELDFSEPEQALSRDSLAAYQEGSLFSALEAYPENAPNSKAMKIYLAGLNLAVGRVDETELLLETLPETEPLALALRELIAAITFQDCDSVQPLETSSQWLAHSYYLQSRSQLSEALSAARRAVDRSPGFGFAWARVGELELSLGNRSDALKALEEALRLSPKNARAAALKGFVLLEERRIDEAEEWFNQAIRLNGAFANGWLGRGLCQLEKGNAEKGRQDLQAAAALEPNRSLPRSYLGKAFFETGDEALAEKELDRARELDPDDPTPWLYSGLFKHQQNRVNEAIDDLEQSRLRNDNRSLFRSKFLLDQDRSVRGADLAAVLLDAGLDEVSQRESSRAVSYDYSNYSAHLYLADSFRRLEDPSRVNLRFESVRESELLLANLLAPAGGENLSQVISQQDHLSFFSSRPVRVSSITDYSDNGDWVQTASLYGNLRQLSYALDAQYRNLNGWRPNEELEETSTSLQVKYYLTPRDSVYFQSGFRTTESGDLAQYYDPDQAKTDFLLNEDLGPNFLVGYHHEWKPGVHTLFLAGRLEDDLKVHDGNPNVLFLVQNNGRIDRVETPPLFEMNYKSNFEMYSTELQQIWQSDRHAFVVGGRYQSGDVETQASLDRALTGNVSFQDVDASMRRFNVYGYYQWQVTDPLRLTAGVSYDRVEYPLNTDFPPLSPETGTSESIAPKVGLLYEPGRNTWIRAMYSRSLGGLFFDNSVRLEPTQIGGFNQTFRSLIPESVAGLVPGTEFDVYGLGFDHVFSTRTYLGVAGEILKSDGDRLIGALTNSGFLPIPDTPVNTPQSLDFEERTFSINLNQLIGTQWAVGVRYRISRAEMNAEFPEIPVSAAGVDELNQDVRSLLQHVNLYLIWNHPSGWFCRWESHWYDQNNEGYNPERTVDSFWQQHFFAGYRFPRRRAEIQLGIMNITSQDYRLNPLNLYPSLPRERTFTARLKFNF